MRVGGQGRRLREGGQGARPVGHAGPRGGQAGDAARARRTTSRTPATRPDARGRRLHAQPPSSTYAVTVDASLTSVDGQTLGYSWSGTVANWHQRAFTSFGDGHGVWESGGGTVLPFYARNIRNVTQWATPIAAQPADADAPEAAAVVQRSRPTAAGTARRLGGQADRIVSHGLDLAGALGPAKTGLVWTAVEEGAADRRVEAVRARAASRASVIQVTNLGITRQGQPAATRWCSSRGSTTARRSPARRCRSCGSTTGSSGAARPAPTASRWRRRRRCATRDDWWKFAFVVTAEKDGDIAYAGSDWNEGIQPWDFGVPFNLNEASPLLRGTVFTDRGVYKLGEEVTFKAVLREDPPDGIHLLPRRHADLRQRPRRPGSGRRRADGQGQHVEQRRVDVARAGRRARSATTACG